MRVWLLIFLLFPTLSWADCSGKPVSLTTNSQGTILVESQYTLDGVILSPNDFRTYFPEDWNQKTDLEVAQEIMSDLSAHCDKLILDKYAKVDTYPIIQNRKILLQSLSTRVQSIKINLKNILSTKTSAVEKIDSDGDGLYDQEWTINSDGTKSVVNITPVPITP